MQKIITYLWFENQAEEAASFYTSIFGDSKILDVQRYGEAGPGPAGSAMIVKFQLEGQEFIALNGGPHDKFNDAVSLYVNCEDQEEVDRLWAALLDDGGQPTACGWLNDKYGVRWQIIPTVLSELLGHPDPEKAGRVMKAMLAMQKIDIQALREA